MSNNNNGSWKRVVGKRGKAVPISEENLARENAERELEAVMAPLKAPRPANAIPSTLTTLEIQAPTEKEVQDQARSLLTCFHFFLEPLLQGSQEKKDLTLYLFFKVISSIGRNEDGVEEAIGDIEEVMRTKYPRMFSDESVGEVDPTLQTIVRSFFTPGSSETSELYYPEFVVDPGFSEGGGKGDKKGPSMGSLLTAGLFGLGAVGASGLSAPTAGPSRVSGSVTALPTAGPSRVSGSVTALPTAGPSRVSGSLSALPTATATAASKKVTGTISSTRIGKESEPNSRELVSSNTKKGIVSVSSAPVPKFTELVEVSRPKLSLPNVRNVYSMAITTKEEKKANELASTAGKILSYIFKPDATVKKATAILDTVPNTFGAENLESIQRVSSKGRELLYNNYPGLIDQIDSNILITIIKENLPTKGKGKNEFNKITIKEGETSESFTNEKVGDNDATLLVDSTVKRIVKDIAENTNSIYELKSVVFLYEEKDLSWFESAGKALRSLISPNDDNKKYSIAQYIRLNFRDKSTGAYSFGIITVNQINSVLRPFAIKSYAKENNILKEFLSSPAGDSLHFSEIGLASGINLDTTLSSGEVIKLSRTLGNAGKARIEYAIKNFANTARQYYQTILDEKTTVDTSTNAQSRIVPDTGLVLSLADKQNVEKALQDIETFVSDLYGKPGTAVIESSRNRKPEEMIGQFTNVITGLDKATNTTLLATATQVLGNALNTVAEDVELLTLKTYKGLMGTALTLSDIVEVLQKVVIISSVFMLIFLSQSVRDEGIGFRNILTLGGTKITKAAAKTSGYSMIQLTSAALGYSFNGLISLQTASHIGIGFSAVLLIYLDLIPYVKGMIKASRHAANAPAANRHAANAPAANRRAANAPAANRRAANAPAANRRAANAPAARLADTNPFNNANVPQAIPGVPNPFNNFSGGKRNLSRKRKLNRRRKTRKNT